MATVLAATYPVNSQMQGQGRRRTQATIQKLEELAPTKVPTLMLVVAVFLDGIQFIVGGILLGMVGIPGIGIIFVVLYHLVNILVTVFFLLLFRLWLHHIGYKGNILLLLGLVVITEYFLSGIIPSWTAFVLRVRYIAHKGNKAKEGLRKLEEEKLALYSAVDAAFGRRTPKGQGVLTT